MADLQTSAAHPSADTPSTSTATTYPAHYVYYDVFINHRGPDVKDTFATYLYKRLLSHGLQPFLDKEELQKGEYIHPQIEGAIRTASVHIAIFSPRYVESPWCLDELLLILSKSGDTVIPVFYNVKPSDLRWAAKNGNGQYAQVLNCLEKSKDGYNHEKIGNWRKALNQVSYIVGFELKAYNGDEAKLLEEVVGVVLKNSRKTTLHVATYPTGLHVKVDDFEKILKFQQQKNRKARVLGIVGLGGAGKTTLAKEFFNRKSCDFNKSFFLFDVRETARLSSLHSLQRKLLMGLTHRTEQIDSIEEGIETLRRHLSFLHVLVVLDDVDRTDQLHAFLPIADILHSESVILVTSRCKDVLLSAGMVESSIYKLRGLNKQHSQQLFCSHAFLQPHPPPGFEYLVDEFCKACDGLPLSLRVLGALLCGKNDKPYWEGQLDKLRQIKLPCEIRERLKISYDALDEDEKQIFLDIACYFIGEGRDMAIKIWDGSGWNGLVGLRNLQDKCLVEVGAETAIKMHDHLRDLGREIADREKSSSVIPHRLWRLIEDPRDLWQQSSVITEVRGIRTIRRFIRYYNIPESDEDFSWFKSWCEQVLGNCLRKLIDRRPYCFRKLQLVATEDGDLESILRRVKSPNLIWLRWNKCPYSSLPSWIPMKNLRVLEVGGKKLKTLWQAEFQAPLELRELNIIAPLSKFPKSIGRLKHIEKIVVKNSNFNSLPEEFCLLPSLKYLLLHGAKNLESLPDSFGDLTNLHHLDLSGWVSLQGLPDSFGGLTNLQHLDLSGCVNLQGLPDSFGFLINLKYLYLTHCRSLQTRSNSFGRLTNLRHLYLTVCLSLQGLPDSFGGLTNLQQLDLSECTSLQGLPSSFGDLSNLQQLDLALCDSLGGLPNSFGRLTKLRYLSITLPAYCRRWTHPEHLYLTFCDNRQELPNAGSVIKIDFLWTMMPGFQDSFGVLTNLKQHMPWVSYNYSHR